jgi:hypothetical protein
MPNSSAKRLIITRKKQKNLLRCFQTVPTPPNWQYGEAGWSGTVGVSFVLDGSSVTNRCSFVLEWQQCDEPLHWGELKKNLGGLDEKYAVHCEIWAPTVHLL